MSTRPRDAVRPACDAVAAALSPADQTRIDLTAPTPCRQLDLRALVDHVVGTTTAMARLGLGEPLDPDHPWGGGQGAADGDWQGRLAENLDAIGRGWSRAEAWTGEARVGGSALPRPMLGEMALVEVAVHGWDITRASDGADGPEVEVPDGAGSLDRALGVVGRDPAWSA